MKNIGLSQLLGDMRMESLLFKVRPDLKDKTDDVKIENHTCERCNEDTAFSWAYKLKGSDNYEIEVIQQICPVCRDKVQAKEVTEQLEKKRRETLRQQWFNLPNPTCGFKNYHTNPNNNTFLKEMDNKDIRTLIKAKNEAMKYTKTILAGETQNVLMTGSVGSGKSHLSVAIARTLDDAGISVAFISAADLFKRIKKTFDSDAETEERIFDEFKSYQVMIIDDLGTESSKIDPSGMSWTMNKLVELINLREGKSTVYSTNLEDDQLNRVLGERAASRLYMNTRFIDLFLQKDYRKNKMVQS